ncbi:hypothetical protein C1I91_01845 [Clostridium manihotivorum]|uniref:Uncharacterized protein n=1 Tax=Clostridium manihotivorum TaxID=2320868 RepID=A0A3R5UD69_9CLOT|nr:hypothetical protein C1I91_01845 [Clostridium manihotivorum]
MLVFFSIMLIVLFIGLGLTISSTILLILCNLYKKKTGKKAHIAIRIILIIVLLVGAAAFIVPTVFLLSCWYDAPKMQHLK